jgi:hypothetical protein
MHGIGLCFFNLHIVSQAEWGALLKKDPNRLQKVFRQTKKESMRFHIFLYTKKIFYIIPTFNFNIQKSLSLKMILDHLGN